MKISAVIIGNYGATNLGDEAILENILASHSEINFTVFSNNPKETESVHKTKATYPLPFGLRSIIRGNTSKSLEALHKCDFVIIGGGGLFTDEKLKAVLLWAWHFFWAKHYKRPVIFYANSVGPLGTKTGRWITKKVFQKADGITVRDKESLLLLEEIGIKNVEVTADPVFLTNPPQKKVRKKKIAISLRNWIKDEETYTNTLKKTVSKLENEGYQVLLISMQSFQDDDRNVLNIITSEKSLIITPTSFSELLNILSECEFAIGMRLHFLIASIITNTPFITLSYSQKTDSLVKTLEMNDYTCSVNETTEAELSKRIETLKKNHRNIEESLRKKLELMKKNAQKNIESLKNFIANFLSKS